MPSRRKAASNKADLNDLQFQIVLGSTVAGSLRIQFVPLPPQRSFARDTRKLAAVIYTLAAEFERRSDQIDADWVVVAEPFRNEMMIEVGHDDDLPVALEFVRQTFGDFAIGHLVGT